MYILYTDIEVSTQSIHVSRFWSAAEIEKTTINLSREISQVRLDRIYIQVRLDRRYKCARDVRSG